MVKNLPANQETQIWSLGWEDPLEKEMTTHFSILAWEIPWTEEPGGLQSGSELHCWLFEVATGNNPVSEGGGNRPFWFYVLLLLFPGSLKAGYFFPKSLFSYVPTHFSFLHLLSRFLVLTTITFSCHFSFALFPLIGLSNPYTYRLNSGFSSSWPRKLKSSTVEGLSFWNCWVLTVLPSQSP